MITVRDGLFQVLRQLGLRKVFGNIGSTEEKMFQHFPADFEYILSLHESVAVAMADAYAQATGHPVHVNLHTAAGTGNAMGSVTTAWYNRTPMIITAGQQTREMLLMEPYLTNKNPSVQLEPWVKWSYEPTRAEDVPGAFLRAYAMAIQSPPGPVFLSLPMDDMDKPLQSLPSPRTIHPKLSAASDVLDVVATALSAARRPVLILGGAVDQAGGWYAAVALAEKLRCEVYGAPMEGRPGFPETHRLYQGLAAPSAALLREQLDGADVVVVIGAPVFRFYPFTGGDPVPHGTKLFHLTDSAEETARAPLGESFLVDPGAACETLSVLVKPSDRTWPKQREEKRSPEYRKDRITSDMLYHALSELKPAGSIIVEEVPSTQSVLRDWLPTAEPRSFFSMFSGVLGYGLPAACGVALARKEEGLPGKVLSLQGDGSTQYTVQAFWNAAQSKLPILFIIFRNREYAVLQSYANFFELEDVPGLKIPGIDSQLLASGYGVPGETLADPALLQEAIQRGLDHDGPYVLQVDVLPEEPPLLGEKGPKTQKETLG